jgi:hypothetical protein
MATGEAAVTGKTRGEASLLQKADVNPCGAEQREQVSRRSPSVAEVGRLLRSIVELTPIRTFLDRDNIWWWTLLASLDFDQFHRICSIIAIAILKKDLCPGLKLTIHEAQKEFGASRDREEY